MAKKNQATVPADSSTAELREKELDLLRLLVDGDWDAAAIDTITEVVKTSPARRALIAQALKLPEDQLKKKLGS